jgi:hypothetical protein
MDKANKLFENLWNELRLILKKGAVSNTDLHVLQLDSGVSKGCNSLKKLAYYIHCKTLTCDLTGLDHF